MPNWCGRRGSYSVSQEVTTVRTRRGSSMRLSTYFSNRWCISVTALPRPEAVRGHLGVIMVDA